MSIPSWLLLCFIKAMVTAIFKEIIKKHLLTENFSICARVEKNYPVFANKVVRFLSYEGLFTLTSAL